MAGSSTWTKTTLPAFREPFFGSPNEGSFHFLFQGIFFFQLFVLEWFGFASILQQVAGRPKGSFTFVR